MKTFANGLAGLTDAQLAAHVHQNNHGAFNVLINRHSPYLERILNKFLPDEEFVKDALQDVKLKVYEELCAGNYRENGYFKMWVNKITCHIAVDMLAVENRYAHEEKETEEPVEVPEEGRSDEEEVAREAFNKLKATDRRIVFWHGRMKMPFEEVGIKVHMSADAVRQRYHRAIKTLMDYVQNMNAKKYFNKPVTKRQLNGFVI